MLPLFIDDGSHVLPYRPFTPILTHMTGDPAKSYGVRVRKRPESTSSPLFSQAARRWIDECATDHACSAYGDQATECLFRHGPHQLIDLHAFGIGADDARIIHTMSPMKDLKYATRSYCWGRDMPAGSKTTTQNIDKREQRLEFLALPQTLKDAFTVSRGLTIQYLWIDALCIFQDSEKDWNLESSKMADIYARSLVTIAADLSLDCTDGFLGSPALGAKSCFDYLIELPSTPHSGAIS